MTAGASEAAPSSGNHSTGATPTQVISRYLSQLAVASSGLDSAVVNDMLADAEQHLWNAVSEGVPAEKAVAEFGEARDVVAAYVASEAARRRGRMGVDTVPLATIAGGQVVPPGAAVPSGMKKGGFASLPVIGVWADRYAWGPLLLFIPGFALATLYFTIVITWASLSLGTIVLIIGFPLLVGLLGFCRVVTLGHGWLIEKLTGVRMPRRTAPVAGVGMASFWGRIGLWLKDGRSWLSVAYLVGNYPVSVALFGVFVGLVSASLGMFFGPFVSTIDHSAEFHFGPWHGDMPIAASLLCMSLGLALMTGTLWLAKGSGWLYAQVAKAIQVTRPVPVGPVQVG